MALPKKQPLVGDGSQTSLPEGPIPTDQQQDQEHDAFDLWLERGLHQLFDEVANEPIPEELLKLIEEDRKQ